VHFLLEILSVLIGTDVDLLHCDVAILVRACNDERFEDFVSAHSRANLLL
jgi:hypothetical protein